MIYLYLSPELYEVYTMLSIWFPHFPSYRYLSGWGTWNCPYLTTNLQKWQFMQTMFSIQLYFCYILYLNAPKLDIYNIYHLDLPTYKPISFLIISFSVLFFKHRIYLFNHKHHTESANKNHTESRKLFQYYCPLLRPTSSVCSVSFKVFFSV